MIRALGIGLSLGLLPAVVATACGRDVQVLDELDGHDVGTMAERQLEAENPTLARGTLTCPDLDFEVGASVRCERTAEVGQGRVVKVGGTVSVTSTASGGRLHVEMDGRAREFGLSGVRLAADLRREYVQRFRAEPTRVDCPYLAGKVGTTVVCRLDAAGGRHDVEVEVTAVDATTYDVDYVTRSAHGAAS